MAQTIIIMRILVVVLVSHLVHGASAGSLSSSVAHKVFCSPKEMTVTIDLPDEKTQVYIDKLKGYPDCHPAVADGKAVFHLSLEDIYTCGTTRVSDIQGRRLYYNRVVLELTKNKKEKLRVKCEMDGGGGRLRRRDVLPEGFVEPDDINITETVIGNGVFPELNVGVRQNGLAIDTQMNVQPGTPLQMEVYLDQNSSRTYGILVNYMNVTDKTPGQKEIIIYKGCSIDPYLFSNFETEDGNHLMAQFRAFKFPESSYVLFIGTVTICIQACQGVPCSNGQTGYGRRRRDVDEITSERDPNQVFEVTMTTILKVDQSEEKLLNRGSLGNAADDNRNQRIPMEPVDDVQPEIQDEPDDMSNDIMINRGQIPFISSSTILFFLLTLYAYDKLF